MVVSPFTLGLFAPLPLAMMIPFMATQSLAMGEAFGKSFQYGKRKISAMSNEEFNKLSLADMMDQQTADIRTLIPKLKEQMNNSKEMQVAIFAEMTKLIPAFMEGLGIGATNPDNIFKPTPETASAINATHNEADSAYKSIQQFFLSLRNAATTSMTGYGPKIGTAITPSSTFTPPEFGDQSPPPPPFDPEVNSAQNEIKYRERIATAAAKARGLASLKKHATQITTSQIRRNTIATSGQSPLAARAQATFKANIDRHKALIESIIQQKKAIPPTSKYNNLKRAAVQKKYRPAVLKLSALRIKYQKVYGQHY